MADKPDMEAVIRRIVVDLADHFEELDDTDDPLFGEYADVAHFPDQGKLIVTHQTEPWGIAITITPTGGDR